MGVHVCAHTRVYKNGMMIYVFINISLFSLQRFILILLLLFDLFGEEIFKEQLDTDGPLRHSLGKGQDFPFPTQVFVFQDALLQPQNQPQSLSFLQEKLIMVGMSQIQRPLPPTTVGTSQTSAYSLRFVDSSG